MKDFYTSALFFPMKNMRIRTLLISAPVCMALIGCNPEQKQVAPEPPRNAVNLQYHFQNPLFVEHYGEELLGHIADLKINQDPVLNDQKVADHLEGIRNEWRAKVDNAEKEQNEFPRGVLIAIEEDALGEVLYKNGVLYFGPETSFVPSQDLRLFVTTVVDPRDTEFPDETAIDLGVIQTPYGPQAYKVPSEADANLYRTVVLFDTATQKIFSFAQLSVRSK